MVLNKQKEGLEVLVNSVNSNARQLLVMEKELNNI